MLLGQPFPGSGDGRAMKFRGGGTDLVQDDMHACELPSVCELLCIALHEPALVII
jgi:hypothetical protein